VYLWPQTQLAFQAPGQLTGWRPACLGTLPSPVDGNASASNWLFSRSVEGIAANATAPWSTAVVNGSDVRVQRMWNAPLGSFFASSAVWMPERRQLFAFGALRIYNGTAAGDAQCVEPQAIERFSIPADQCVAISNDSYVFDLASSTWRTYSAQSAGLPYDPALLYPDPGASTASPIGLALSPVWVPPLDAVVVVSGGYRFSTSPKPAPTFAFSPANGTWRSLNATGDGPLVRADGYNVRGVVVYLPVSNEIMSFGGNSWDLYQLGLRCLVLSLTPSPPVWRTEPRCSYNAGPWVRSDALSWTDPGSGAAFMLGGRNAYSLALDMYTVPDFFAFVPLEYAWQVRDFPDSTSPTPWFAGAGLKGAHDSASRRTFV